MIKFIGLNTFESRCDALNIRRFYGEMPEFFANGTGLPEKIVSEYFSDDGRALPYEAAFRITKLVNACPHWFCREEYKSYYSEPDAQKNVSKYYNNDGRFPIEVMDTSLEPLGIMKGDILHIQDDDEFLPTDLVCVMYYTATVFGFAENCEDGSMIIRIPNGDYLTFTVSPDERKRVRIFAKVTGVTKFYGSSTAYCKYEDFN